MTQAEIESGGFVNEGDSEFNPRARFVNASIARQIKAQPSDISKLAEILPGGVVHLLLGEIPDIDPATSTGPEADGEQSRAYLKKFLPLAWDNPRLLMRCARLWGGLIDCAERRAKTFRRDLVRAAAKSEPSGWGGRIMPFPVDLSSEAALMPHIVNITMGRDSSLTWHEMRPDAGSAFGRSGGFISAYFPSAEALGEFARSSEQDVVLRAAAATLYLGHPRGGFSDLQGRVEPIVSAWGTGDGLWLEKGFLWAAELGGNCHDEDLRLLIGALLQKSRNNYAVSRGLQKLLLRWREVSNAPVSSGGLIERWLAGSG